MSDLFAVVVTIGTIPPGQNTGIAVPPIVLNVSIPTDLLPIPS